MELKINLSDLVEAEDESDFEGRAERINAMIEYIRAARAALESGAAKSYKLPSDVADWLRLALGDPSHGDKRMVSAKLCFVHVMAGQAAAMDGHRLHVHDVSAVPDGVYYLLGDLLVEAQESAFPWDRVVPDGEGDPLALADGECYMIRNVLCRKWTTPYPVFVDVRYWNDALYIDSSPAVYAYAGSKVRLQKLKLVWPNKFAIVMPMAGD